MVVIGLMETRVNHLRRLKSEENIQNLEAKKISSFLIKKVITSSTADMCDPINTIALKMVKVSKLVQRKLYRSIIFLGGGGGGYFERLNILEIFQDSYCAYRDLTIKSKLFKNIFLLSCLFTIHNINPTAEKSSKN